MLATTLRAFLVQLFAVKCSDRPMKSSIPLDRLLDPCTGCKATRFGRTVHSLCCSTLQLPVPMIAGSIHLSWLLRLCLEFPKTYVTPPKTYSLKSRAWVIDLPFTCTHLGAANKCGIWLSPLKPIVCSEYSALPTVRNGLVFGPCERYAPRNVNSLPPTANTAVEMRRWIEQNYPHTKTVETETLNISVPTFHGQVDVDALHLMVTRPELHVYYREDKPFLSRSSWAIYLLPPKDLGAWKRMTDSDELFGQRLRAEGFGRDIDRRRRAVARSVLDTTRL